MHTEFQLGSLKGRDCQEDLGVDGRIVLKWILGKYGWRVWIGFVWLRIGTSGKISNIIINLHIPKRQGT
jgi:hypothetical protein